MNVGANEAACSSMTRKRMNTCAGLPGCGFASVRRIAMLRYPASLGQLTSAADLPAAAEEPLACRNICQHKTNNMLSAAAGSGVYAGNAGDN